MKPTDKQLNDMIQQSQFAKPEAKDDFWFSYQNQRRHAYNLAQELFLSGMDADEAISTAKDFINKFYHQAIRPGSWERY